VSQPDDTATVATSARAARILNADNAIRRARYALSDGRLSSSTSGSDAEQNAGKCEVAGHVVLLNAMDGFNHAAWWAAASMGQRVSGKG
jgi:hypothetical protein